MSKTDKTTEASQTELSDSELENAQGGAVFAKYDGVDGESKDARVSESFSLNFGKIEVEYAKDSTKLEPSKTTLKR